MTNGGEKVLQKHVNNKNRKVPSTVYDIYTVYTTITRTSSQFTQSKTKSQ